jgi:hypothetical protein
VPPAVAERVVLIEEVVFPFEEHEPVRVVHEVALRGEVEARAHVLIGATRERCE